MMKWYFPLANNVNRKGLSDSGIETFKGQLLESLTREIVQNTLDAKLKDKDSVIVEFNYFEIPTEKFPDKEGFVQNLLVSYEEGKNLKDSKTRDFFDNAIELFNKPQMTFLRISDYNTTGLTGSNTRESSNWNNLVKSTGISDKGQSAGGSFGIGKSAPFACSQLHTVFYSTLDENNIEAYQGVANLISVENQERTDFTQGIGQLSESEELRPLSSQLKLQNNHNRTTSGTDIYIAGFYATMQEFENGIIKSVMDNFLYAIYEGTLVIQTNKMLINKQTLSSVIGLNKSILELETVELFELLTSKDTNWFEDFENGQAKLGIALSPGGSRKVSAIRRPWMKIQSLTRFTKGIEFKGTFIIKGDNLNKLLRKMENPQHDKWEPDRLEVTRRTAGKNLLKDINKYINDKVQGLIEINLDGEQEVYGAEDYITLIDDDKKAKRKVKDTISSVEVKKVGSIINPQSVYDYGMTDAIVDADGEIPNFDGVVKYSLREQNPTPYSEKVTMKRGKLVKIQQNQIKLFKNHKDQFYHLHYKSKSEAKSVHFSIFALDEEGNRIKNVLKVMTAYQGEKALQVDEAFINDIKLEGGVCNIKFLINIKESISLGVDVHENS